MLRNILLSVGLFLLVFGASPPADAQQGEADPRFVAGELLIQPRAGATPAAVAAALQAAGANVLDEIPQLQIKRIRVPEQAFEQVQAALSRNPHFAFAEPNYLATGLMMPNDPSYSKQWHLPKISAPAGWDLAQGSAEIVIAVIDSGIDASHPDLAGKVLPGYNFVDRNSDSSDVLGHGTAVAGSAAASGNNGLGVAGVAWRNPILPLRVLNSSNWATYADIASAITYATDHGARVLNISIAGSSSSSALQSAVNYAWNQGAMVVAAAANEATSAPYYPAACSNAVAVAATTSTDALASYSNFGNWIDLAAPGSSIYTTNRGGGYGSWSGTSFASPVTAGLAALVWSANPALSNSEVLDLLLRGADDLGTAGFDTTYGNGRVNVYRSLALTQASQPQPDSQPPNVAIASPADGATVSNTAVISVTATDNVAVARVELWIDGSLFASDTSAPFGFAWDTLPLSDGWRTLTAKAIDSAGNDATSLPVAVLVSNPRDTIAPTAAISSPLPGSQINSSRETVTAQGWDNVAVARLELYLDGRLVATSYSDRLNWNWNTRKVKAGSHTLQLKAFDGAGNSGSDLITIYR